MEPTAHSLTWALTPWSAEPHTACRVTEWPCFCLFFPALHESLSPSAKLTSVWRARPENIDSLYHLTNFKEPATGFSFNLKLELLTQADSSPGELAPPCLPSWSHLRMPFTLVCPELQPPWRHQQLPVALARTPPRLQMAGFFKSQNTPSQSPPRGGLPPPPPCGNGHPVHSIPSAHFIV